MQHFNDPVDIKRPVSIRQKPGMMVVTFDAMASPCEIIIDSDDMKQAQLLGNMAAHETWRIEQKFSRYRTDGIIPAINNSNGQPVTVDTETAMLLDFAFHCYQISNGLFDITSGVLRKAFTFDGSDRLPSPGKVKKLLAHVGLEKIAWQNPEIRMQPGMEIDLGGIGKEYAVDRVQQLLAEVTKSSILINFGGDIAVSGPRRNGEPWNVGIEATDTPEKAQNVAAIKRGGIATSGDAQRFLLKNGKRYSHILNPKTGWPVEGSPHAVTVLADTCTQAGILSTLAMLHGKNAEAFLRDEGVDFWAQR